MSLVDPVFESNVITLLKGIYDNIGGQPTNSINGSFFQDLGSGEVIVRYFSGEALAIENNLSITSAGSPGGIALTMNRDLSTIQLFTGPLSEKCVMYTIFSTTNPIDAQLISWDVSGGEFVANPAGFANPVSFEIRLF